MFNRCTNLSLKFFILFWAFIFLGTFAFSSEAGVKNPAKNLSSVGEKQNYLPILNRWSGDGSYKQMLIAKVTLKDNVAEMVADGNTSGSPGADNLAVALAAIPRAGVKFVRVGKEQIPVE